MLLSPLEDPGLTVLPTHRVITTPLPPKRQVTGRLADTFDLTEFVYDIDERSQCENNSWKHYASTDAPLRPSVSHSRG